MRHSELFYFYFLKRLFETEDKVGRGAKTEGEAESPLSGEPDLGLDPGTMCGVEVKHFTDLATWEPPEFIFN